MPSEGFAAWPIFKGRNAFQALSMESTVAAGTPCAPQVWCSLLMCILAMRIVFTTSGVVAVPHNGIVVPGHMCIPIRV